MAGFALVLSPGRTGTLWLATLLAQDRGVWAAHEEGAHDGKLCSAACRKPNQIPAQARVLAERFRRRAPGRRAVIEINGLLRYHAQALAKELPGLQLAYLARDGRRTIASIHNRKLPGFSQVVLRQVAKDARGPFEAACLYWARTSKFLRQICPRILRLEELTTSYEAFERAAGELGARIDRPTWEAFRKKRLNHGLQDGPWTEWHEERFRRLAGTEQAALGYKET